MRKIIGLSIVAFILMLAAIVVYKEQTSASSRKHNWAMAKGVIVQVGKEMMNGSTNMDVTYKVQIDGKDITRTTRITCAGSMGFFLYNKSMDVVYEKGNPENCQMLLSRKDYQEYYLLPSKETLHVIEALEASCGG